MAPVDALAMDPVYMPDQTTPPPVRTICVTSGKGGVGKTTVAVNLALALIGSGKRVMLLDADLGLANVDVMLGLGVRRTLAHLLRGECTMNELLVEGPHGLQVVPSGSGLSHMTRLGLAEQAGLVHAFSELETVPDVLVVDTAAGIGDAVCNFCVASQEVLITICPEPTSITDVTYTDTGTLNVGISATPVSTSILP